MSAVASQERPIKSLIPVRMDRMPWARFHWMVIFGLGTAWILDGLEIQLVASAGYAKTLGMSSTQVGLTSTIYLLGQVSGALIFGRLTDKWGRKRLFIITLAVYLIGSGIAGLSPTVWFLYIFRFIAGMGIGGEYSAINSAIDELIPGKYRGRVDLAIRRCCCCSSSTARRRSRPDSHRARPQREHVLPLRDRRPSLPRTWRRSWAMTTRPSCSWCAAVGSRSCSRPRSGPTCWWSMPRDSWWPDRCSRTGCSTPPRARSS